MPSKKLRHLILPEPPSVKKFSSSPSFGQKRIPVRDRNVHAEYLFGKFNAAWKEAENERAVALSTRQGVYIEFKSDPGMDLMIKSLEDMTSKQVRLLNVRMLGDGDEAVTLATVYVSNEKKGYFLKKILDYANAEKDRSRKDGEPAKPRNSTLLNSISDINKAMLVESFWQDKKESMPTGEKIWCEVWLSSDSEEVLARFEQLLTKEEIQQAKGFVQFPERTVKLILVNRKDLEHLTILSDDIAEYRLGIEIATPWLEMENREQAEWVKGILNRLTVNDGNVAVCVLDTGINHGHPLLSPILKNEDCQTVDPLWGVDDHKGHGTLMAGLAAYGDLRRCLAVQTPIILQHCLESVKILPRSGNNKEELWAYITSQAVSRAEIQSPNRRRFLCLAVAAPHTIDRGRPSSWSGGIDKDSSGADDNRKRLFLICAGNMRDFQAALTYPHAQQVDSIWDPGQSWNALTVGAYTELDLIKDKKYAGYFPVAPCGGLSPFSTTSLTWEEKWPIKPDVVMEGGNIAQDGQGQLDTGVNDLSLLSTYRDPAVKHFEGVNMTSAATAQAACLSAQISAAYPNFWPETVRALIVHSAQWTETLKKQFLDNGSSKTDYSKLLRFCGYGVPDLGRALYSASNSLTLIAQNELQPFIKKSGQSTCGMNEMHLYELPWPKEVLMGLPDNIKVQMRVTLSYFVEPGPGKIGWKDRYRYASHGLRFDLKSPNEPVDLFMKRINIASREDGEASPGTASAANHWVIGSTGRDRGSIHSDIWEGTPADLAESGVIGICPVIGWWRERAHLNKWDKKSRYALIVSIYTPDEKVDIYTPVANKIGITIPSEIDI